MSILGLTIDYGPFGFMEHYNPKHICNHSDKEGRYSYEAQPDMCMWNCEILRQCLNQFIPTDREVMKQNYLRHYSKFYDTEM